MKIKFFNPFFYLKILKLDKIIDRKSIIFRLINRSLSKIFQNIFKYEILTKFLNLFRGSKNIEMVNQLWILRIGYRKRRNFLPFINVDPYLSNLMDAFFTKMPFFCVKIQNIPLPSNSCQEIKIKHFFKYYSNSNGHKMLETLYDILIPGGKLQMRINGDSKEVKIEELLRTLRNSCFEILNIDKSKLNIDNTILIVATKKINQDIELSNIPNRKIDEIILILKQTSSIILNSDKICMVGYAGDKILKGITSHGYREKDIDVYESISEFFDLRNKTYDVLIIQNLLEFCNREGKKNLLSKVKEIVKPSGKILIILPEKFHFYINGTKQIFEKSIILKEIDQINLSLEWINLNSNFNMIQILLENKERIPTEKKKERIFLLGNYSLRYSYLINARWDSQARALEELGYELKILDIKDNSFTSILRSIKEFNPDILWTGGKYVIEFFKKYEEFLRKEDIKVLYWLWDIKIPKPHDFKDVIDYMLVTTKDDIPKYQKAYNIDNVFWMPAAITPQIIHKNPYIKKKYDIGFAGSLDKRFHKKRTEIVEFIQNHYNLKLFQNVYNNLPEHYSQCKIVLGGSPDQKDYELYASNRIFVCMSCSCCFLTNYFKGLDRLAENKRHLLWYDSKEDLVELLDLYLKDEDLRNSVEKKARDLAFENHDYRVRIKNIIDILKNKTKYFYGFIPKIKYSEKNKIKLNSNI